MERACHEAGPGLLGSWDRGAYFSRPYFPTMYFILISGSGQRMKQTDSEPVRKTKEIFLGIV